LKGRTAVKETLERMWNEVMAYFKVLSKYVLKKWGKSWKMSIRITGLWAKIQAWDLVNMK